MTNFRFKIILVSNNAILKIVFFVKLILVNLKLVVFL